ncbi:MAG: CBS domain-containing protein [Pirellulaceae bacterium]|nr:CBS domain-containing protein [Pirellulaceae bacterium]
MTGPRVARDIMKSKIFTLSQDMDLHDAAKFLMRHKISGAPVVDEHATLEGILTEKDLMTALIDAVYENLPSTKVRSYMNVKPLTVAEDMGILSIVQIFQTKPFRRLPVVTEGKLVGQISRRDVLESVVRLIEPTQDHTAAMLYLSALRDADESPFQ